MQLPTSFRISGLDRVMECEGSVTLESPELPPHPAAAEGTAAGEYLRHLIEGTQAPSHASNGIAFDTDMKFYAADTLPKIVPGARCEEEIRFMTASGIELIGHYDAAAVYGTDLFIEDYKYGWGIVDVKTVLKDGSIKPNWQLVGYAAAYMRKYNPAVTHITMKIHQPRPHHEEGPTRTWRIPVHQLWSYVDRIEERMMSLKRGGKELVTGKQCKYCKHAMNSCPAFKRTLSFVIETSLYNYVPDSISNDGLAAYLELFKRAEDVLEIAKKSVEQLAVIRINEGEIIPGYISERNYGDRKWKSWVSPQVISAMANGIKITKEEMMSPNQAEKVGVPKDLVASMIDRHYIGQKLVRKDASDVGAEIFNKPLIGGMPYGK